jgi:Mg2+/citrate symporter
MAFKVLLILLSLFASGLLVGNELAVAVFIHPVLYSVSDEAHVRVAKPLARRLGHSMPFWYALSLVFAILQMLIIRAAPAAQWLCCAAAILLALNYCSHDSLVGSN